MIVGRAKDVIVASNGENVYPDDVEARSAASSTSELAIVGIADGRGGERVACVAVADAEASGSPRRAPRARQARARSRAFEAAAAARPAVVTVIDNKLPRTATRKVKRRSFDAWSSACKGQ